jgi:hypothetical protein
MLPAVRYLRYSAAPQWFQVGQPWGEYSNQVIGTNSNVLSPFVIICIDGNDTEHFEVNNSCTNFNLGIILFICGLFNSVAKSVDYRRLALNDRMNSE